MKIQLDQTLSEQLKIVPFRHKQSQPPETEPPTVEPSIDKQQLRLLVKILQAIGHHCEYQNISMHGSAIHYQHPSKTLIFDSLSKTDDQAKMHLASLAEMLTKPQLKRPVWEKLKTLM